TIIAFALAQLQLASTDGDKADALVEIRQLQWTELVYQILHGAAEYLLSGRTDGTASQMPRHMRRRTFAVKAGPEIVEAVNHGMRECLFHINGRKEWRSMRHKDWYPQLCIMT